MFVQQGFLLETMTTRQPLRPSAPSPFLNGARSATEALMRLQLEGVQVNLAGLRWFQNVRLIDKPGKDGRNAVYSQEMLDEIASMRALQILYGRSVDDLLRLRKRHIAFTETLRHLLRLEADVVREAAGEREEDAWRRTLVRLSLASEFFDRVLEAGVHPNQLRRRIPKRLIFRRSKRATE